MKTVRGLCFLSFLGLCLFPMGLTATAESAFVPRRMSSVVTVPTTAVPPVLDGKLDDAAWAPAQPLRDWAYKKKGVQQQTEAYFTRDDTYFYLAFRAFEDNLNNLVLDKTGRMLWKNDCIELFFVPEKNEKLWSHLMFDAEGKMAGNAWLLDEWGEPVEGGEIAMQCKAGREADAWILELAIPINAFGLTLSADKRWAFGANRERWAVLTEASSFQGGFNRPLEYPDLVFADWDIVFDGVGVKNRSAVPQVASVKIKSGDATVSKQIELQPGESSALEWESVVAKPKAEVSFSVELLNADGTVKGREEYTLIDAPMKMKAVDATVLANPVFRPSVLDDPDFFPVGVWLQPANDSALAMYKEIGVNVYFGGIGSYPRPRDGDWLDAVAGAGMYAILPLEEKYIANGLYTNAAVIGWHTQDEPDLSLKEYNGGPVPPAVLGNQFALSRSQPVQLPVFLNLSCGVGDDRFPGRAAGFDMFPDYCKSADRLSFDIYPCNSLGADGEERFCTIAKGLDRLYTFGGGTKKLGFFVEVNKFTKESVDDSRSPTPAEVKSQIWIALVHRAQQITLFCHSWAEGKVNVSSIDSEMQAALKNIVAEIKEMAPVLNAPFLPEGKCAIVKSTMGSRVDCLTKEHDGDLYLICANMYNRPDQAEITIPGVQGGTATVLFEDRRVSISDGKIVDDFAPYQIHRYQIDL